ncbi:unnamed protein product [Arabidopsis arenosa]|uniref:Legume lectin domain-containing protein n=1 Tax=Arabidopsis arenosa TaxID=38785 RepID=A0A8S2AMA4_ARAAE|nr:unnamed protein product [Arabidopsis arenosa]
MKALLFLLTLFLILPNPISAIDFVFNGFNDSSSNISLFGIATIESKILTLTNQTSFATGRALYSKIIRTKDLITSSVLPFSTSFIFTMAPFKNTLPGHGIVFLFAPTTGINGSSSAQHLATGRLVQSHKILAWSFSNSNFSLSDSLITTGLPSFVLPKDSILKAKWFVFVLALICFLVVAVVGLVLFAVVRKRLERARKRALMEDWEMEYWPHRIPYEEIESGTKGFDEKNVIGIGGNGKVYKGDKAEIFEADSSEDVESWMLKKMGSRGISREFWYGSSSHPTIEQIRLQSLSVSLSSWNSSILEGR